ncbi:MAG TPA: preprotein translocase subunit SecE [Spirochaetales bacterium]|nr:preprotein translocase subunit SecE [Spirochaetales bacterium]
MKKIIQFIEESIAEMKKVVWPSREEIIASTKVVLVSVLIFALLLGVVDFLFLLGLDWVF